jgi:hypothetical protein
MTKAEVQALIDLNLATASNITATEHRAALTEVLNYASKFDNILLKGTYVVGDCSGSDTIKTVTFPTVGTDQYIVTGSLVSKSTNYNSDNDVFWMIKDRTATEFKLCLREVSSDTQNLEFDYILIKK